MFRTLYFKLSVILLGLLAALGAVQYFMFGYLFLVGADETEQIVNWELAKSFARQLQPLLEGDINYRNVQVLAHEITAEHPKISIYLLDSRGSIIGDFGENERRQVHQVDLDAVQRFLNTSDYEVLPIYGTNPRDRVGRTIFSASRISIGGEPGYLYVSLRNGPETRIQSVLGGIRRAKGIFAYLSLSIMVAAAAGIGIFALPMKRFISITAVVSEFAGGNFSRRIKLGRTKDEIEFHAQTINQMADTIQTNIQELERRDQLRRELIANVSHDIRGPVALISGYSEELVNNWEKMNDAEKQDASESILKGAGSLTRFLDELFELAKLEAAEIRPKEQEFHLSELAEDIIAIYQKAATQKRIDLSMSRSVENDLVSADPAMIERVIVNLIQNAIRYTPEGGKIELRLSSPHERLRVEVIDTGIGIADSDLPHLFDRFYQGRKKEGTEHGVSGLGLAIVKKLVEAHGSNIKVDTVENEGTIFSFELQRGKH